MFFFSDLENFSFALYRKYVACNPYVIWSLLDTVRGKKKPSYFYLLLFFKRFSIKFKNL